MVPSTSQSMLNHIFLGIIVVKADTLLVGTFLYLAPSPLSHVWSLQRFFPWSCGR